MRPLKDPALYSPPPPFHPQPSRLFSEWQEMAGRESTGEEEREKAIALDSKCHVARKWSRKPGMKLDAVFLNLLPGVNRDAAPQSDACKRVRRGCGLPQSPPSCVFPSCLA